ncbi:uncharacterized protein C8Q71DRAFT_762656 [Rhodofomes roseus]|uniref:F-box domain-containing protein n=1 Tax=Rhodofomes roseus TaxID=34475 RepID=A0ABQ8KDF2_9APHY|nr:uncharacterized protein C8Q71DRAFT_762656 [Rhodofomes roseus]KAH9835577.1 hypothetical protein C8Q71DRAFT_762656 [Rhodofomes roseus]
MDGSSSIGDHVSSDGTTTGTSQPIEPTDGCDITAKATFDKVIEGTKATGQDPIGLALAGRQTTLVNRLSPELLTGIFLLYAPLTVAEPALLEEPTGNLGAHVKFWVLVSQVCKTWRSIALDFPFAWSQLAITAENMDWMTEVLARSKSVPLDIEVLAGESAIVQEYVYELIDEELDRIRSLRFHRCNWVTHALFGTLLDCSSLESLHISSEPAGSRAVYMEGLMDELRIVENLKSAAYARVENPQVQAGEAREANIGLRRLELRHCIKGPLQLAGSISALWHLAITGNSVLVATHFVSLSTAADVPLKTLDLEVDLTDSFPIDTFAIMQSPVHLSRLRVLRVKACLHDCVVVLGTLDLQHLTRLVVEISTRANQQVTGETFAAALAPKLAALGPLSSLRMYRGIPGNATAVCIDGLDGTDVLRFTLVFHLCTESILLATLARLRATLGNVLRVCLRDLVFDSLASWVTLFRSFPNAERLDLNGRDALIAFNTSQTIAPRPDVPIFPRLRVLVIRKTVLHNACNVAQRFALDAGRCPLDCLGRLLDCLSMRCAAGAGIAELHMVHCPKDYLTPEDLHALR